MSIFDDEPLPAGTRFWENEILDFDRDSKKYLVRRSDGQELWQSQKNVEGRHGDYLLSGVEVRTSKPGNAYNTRYFRRNPDK
jgi:hypothetical protein